MIVNGVQFSWWLITSGVPQGLVLRPVLFKLFISYLDERIEYALNKFADDTELGSSVDLLGGKKIIRRIWMVWINGACPITRHSARLNTGACTWVITTQHSSRTGEEWMESCWAEKELGLLVVSQLNMSQQYTQIDKKASGIPASIRSNMISRTREVTFHLYVTLVRLHLEYCVWGPLLQER